METLPPEVLETIVRQLTPQDLARCSAVCREWHEIFNQDWIWEPLCKPELEEPLRTIPCMATPKFEALEGSLPVCYWKTAFMRESRFWKNWSKSRDERFNSLLTRNAVKYKRKTIRQVDFFSDSEVVVWCSNHIEILNVGVIPAVVVAKTDTPIVINDTDRCYKFGTNMLTIEKVVSNNIVIEVFIVDTAKESIKLKHSIDCNQYCPLSEIFNHCLFKGHFYLHVTGTQLVLYDLNSGTLLKKHSFPINQNTPSHRHEFKVVSDGITSPSSDFVVIVFHNPSDETFKYFYTYSMKDLKFLPDVIVTDSYGFPIVSRSWLAINFGRALKVVNLLNNEEYTFPLDFSFIEECGDSFVIECIENGKSMLKRYNPSVKSLTNICELKDDVCAIGYEKYKIINNTFIAVFESENPNACSENVWKLSGQKIEKWNIYPFSISYCEINQTLTKMLMEGPTEFSIFYLW